MGCATGTYLVWDGRRNRKIQSGFPAEQKARQYIRDRQMVYRGWYVARFTSSGIKKVVPRYDKLPVKSPNRRRYISPELKQEILARYTGAYGEQKELALEYGLSTATVNRICLHERVAV